MNKKIRITLDIALTILLPLLMIKMLTGQELHEWLGIAMVVIFIAHHAINFNWHKKLFSGDYTAVRALNTLIDILMIADMLGLAYSGIAMSSYVLADLDFNASMIFVRKLHLFASFWGLLLMATHLGMHFSMMLKMLLGKKDNSVAKAIGYVFSGIVIIWGIYGFISLQIGDYIFLRTVFMYFDSTVPEWLYIMQFLGVMLLFAVAGFYINALLSKLKVSNKLMKYVTFILAIAIIVISYLVVSGDLSFGKSEPEWGNNTSFSVETQTELKQDSKGESKVIEDNLLFIKGGTFLMGSPDSEAWRIEDETQHEVTVGDFYISPYEVTQAEYSKLMGNNPSMFPGEKLPVESVSWLDAIKYCNALSENAGLTPVYSITENGVSWDKSADGYRLPTEAEWEFACRAGTTTPFNTEEYIGADKCNFYGHYPYMIEGNYFNQSSLTTKPGEYRQTTVAVGTFDKNAWGLYDCHGNVGEWVWDIYGAYDTSIKDNPTGPDNGTMHISRGGGWNDFGKNLRSAYRATSMDGQAMYNVGIRVARGPVAGGTGDNKSVNTKATAGQTSDSSKMLIVYYSWSGNTRGVAKEIQKQTGADIFEIELEVPYSTNYDTVLEQAQHDQSIQARPIIKNKIDNIAQYDTIFIGYPNWWASIPMPIASFLDDYDLSGKTIMPFCSHGGGKFGQSLTAIAKAEPNAIMKNGLSIHYSGGNSLSADVQNWLESSK